MKKITEEQLKSMKDMGGAAYAIQEAWDIRDASIVLQYVAGMCMNEVDEPDDMQSLANIMKSLMEFINGEIQEMVTAAKQGESYSKSDKVPAEPRSTFELNTSYVKSLGVDLDPKRLAVKYVGKNTIAHPVFIWGDAKKTDLEIEYFNQQTNFWDSSLKDAPRPLTWDHGQDEKFSEFETDPVIGKTVKYYDDAIARWAESVIETDKKYRKYIDQFIEEKRLGYSSDSAPQYVQREKQGKAIYLKTWPWFGGALTASPCEPRMKVYTPEYIKALGIILPDVHENEWQNEMMLLDYYKSTKLK